MSESTGRHVSEEQARQVAEESRQTTWDQPSFMKEMFLGNLRLDLIHPYPESPEDDAEFQAFYEAIDDLLRNQLDPIEVDVTGEYPEDVVDSLRKLGAFGMKIPKKYGGLGFSIRQYQKVMHLVGSVDGNIGALLSAHQSIGVPQPLKLFGSDVLKEKYLPRCARGEISAFALTEMDVGSDPARLATTAIKTENGDYILNGTKLWCTNGTIADLLVVMARDDAGKISAFVVETGWEGVELEKRCHFMGLRALANGIISFSDVRVPAENLIGSEGRGLKIALTTLNDGRLSIPNMSVGGAKAAIEICRTWSAERVQWGKPVGKHEAISHLLANMAATTFAMEAIVEQTIEMADSHRFDIRLEAAACKEWVTYQMWEIVDDTMQIRGGRGYETESSLADRGEVPIGVERMMRDYRINKIFEGSSEIMHLFMAREAVDKHLQVAGDLIDPRKSLGQKFSALVRSAAFYIGWYPTRWLGWGRWPRYGEFGDLAKHMRFVNRSTRRLARQVFHGMVAHGPKLQHKQGFLFRIVDIANELFAMASSISRAQAMSQRQDPEAAKGRELAASFCRSSTRTVKRLFHELWSNDDAENYDLGVRVMEGEHSWLEQGALGVYPLPEAHGRFLRQPTVEADAVEIAPEPAPPVTVS